MHDVYNPEPMLPTLTIPDLETKPALPALSIDPATEKPVEVSVAAVPAVGSNGKGRGRVVITFNHQIDWFQLTPRNARQLAELIRKKSYEAER